MPGAKPFILRSSVPAAEREEVIERRTQEGYNIMLCNARLVATGLDLVSWPVLAFYELEYSLLVIGQAARRAWRLNQRQACVVYYLYYLNTMEQQAVELVGRKQSAANLVASNGEDVLSRLAGTTSLMTQLAATIDADESVVDLRDLFREHARAQTTFDPEDSAWLAQMHTAAQGANLAAKPVEPPKARPTLAFALALASTSSVPAHVQGVAALPLVISPGLNAPGTPIPDPDTPAKDPDLPAEPVAAILLTLF